MKYFTLKELHDLRFEGNSEGFTPDPLVQYEEDDDEDEDLMGRRVALLIHPLLIVCGSDEAKDYDQERVLARGIVWVNRSVK